MINLFWHRVCYNLDSFGAGCVTSMVLTNVESDKHNTDGNKQKDKGKWGWASLAAKNRGYSLPYGGVLHDGATSCRMLCEKYI